MKPNRKNLLLASSAAIILTLASRSAQASTFYWDSTPTTSTAGFGTAAGTWTSQNATSGGGRWVTSATGVVSGSASQVTSNADTFNYGTATDGLAAGTITIGGTLATPINVGSITFGSASGAINLNSGFLAFGASKSITVNNTTNTIGSVIQGSNGFTKNGAGALILTGNNTYAGQTTVANDGTLTLSGDNSAMVGNVVLSTASGTGPRLNINSATAIGTGTLSFGGGLATDAVRIDNTSGSAVSLTTANAITLNRNFTFVGTRNLNLGTGTATLGGMTAGTNRTITVTANTLTFGGTIAEAAANLGINKQGAGTLVLAAGNTYAGSTKVSGGSLSLGHSEALANSAFDTTSITGTASAGLRTTVTTLTMGGLTGGNNLSTRFTTTSGGYTGLTALTLNPGAGVSHTYSGDIGNGAGTMTLTKSGAGTQILTGTNTHSGGTTVNNNGGTLKITDAGALGSGPVTISTAGANTGTLELALTGTNSLTNTFNGFNSTNALTSATPGNAQILNTSGNNTISSDLTVTGTGGTGLNVVSDGGLLTLSGTITSTVSAGGRTLSLGGSGDGVVSGAINNDTVNTLTFAVNKSGAGTWTLSNASNTYTGATAVSGGTLKFGNNNVIANLSAVTVGGGATSGTLDIAGFSDTLGTSAAATMLTLGSASTTVGGLQNQVINSGGSAVLTVDGGITYNAGTGGFNNGKALVSANLQVGNSATSRNISVQDSSATAVDMEITGVLSSSTNTITKEGAGTLFLNNDNNTVTGQFIINNGKLQVTKLANTGSNSSLGTGSGTSAIRLGDTLNPTLEYVGASDSSTNRRIVLGTTGGGSTGASILNNGAGKLTFSDATGFNNTNVATIARTLTLGGANTLDNTIAGAIIDNTGVGGTVGVTKQDAGTWILDGTNTYSGATTVNGGTLVVNGSISTGNVTVSGTGSTLKGSGTIDGSVTIENLGTLATGTSIESLATGALSFTTGSNFQYELDKDVAATAAGDLTAVTGSLSLAGTVNLSFIETGSGSWELGTPLGDHFGSPAADKLTLISYNGTWNGGLFTYLGNTVLDDSGIIINGQQWWFNYNDTDAGTNFTGDLGAATRFVTIAVPEPRAALLGGLGLLMLARRRR